MMKTIIKTTLMLLALQLPATTLAYDFEVDGIYYNINGNEAIVTYPSRGLSYSGDVAIPESIVYNDVTYPVTAIGNLAFDSYSGITSVFIPNSITSIGNYAFGDCTGLTSIDSPNSVTSIGSYAFDGCTGLTNMTIPHSVTTIGNNPFMHGTNLTSLSVDPDNPNYDSRNNCNAIIETATNTLITGCSSTVIPNTVTAIGNSAFYGCSGLTSVSIPNSITSIGSHVFADCSSLTNMSVDPTNPVFDSRDNCNAIIEKTSNTLIAGCSGTIIPNTVITIGTDAFYRCMGLTCIDIPNSVTSIGASAFSWCAGLTSVSIPNSVTEICARAFFNCTGLTSVSIPNSVITIGDRAFLNCSGLTSVNIPNSVTTIGERAFESCTGLTAIIIPKSVTSIGSCAFASCSSLASASIPSSVTSIGGYAFSYCDKLNVVYSFIVDPSQITMGDGVFYCVSGDYSTRTLYVASNIWRYQNDSRWSQYFDNIQTSRFEVDGIYYQMTNVDEVCVTSGGNYTGEVIIPETVTYDGVTYPVTAIGEMAFYSCHELTSVTIPNTVSTIGREAFEGSGLTSIVIPSSVTFIDEYAFIECDALQSMVMDMDNPVYDSRNNCNAIIETASNTLISGCQNTVIPVTVTSIGDASFEYCTGLTRISIPNSVVTIGNRAFCDCTGLTSVEFGNSVTIIDEEAFEGCSSLTSVVIPNSVTFIGFEAFAYCSSLTSATIGKSLTTIEDRIFYYCSNLTDVYCEITDPTNISMGNEVFYKYPKEYSGRTLHVPAGSIPLYQASDKWYPYFGQIVEMSAISGDVDGDGQVGIADVTDLIDMILEGSIEILTNPAADVDGDGRIGIADVTEIIDRVLSGN